MEKFYVLGHSSHRLRDDFFPCGTHVKKPPCPACGGNLNELVAPFLFFWDFEFGDPQASIDAGHHCFWGQFQLMVNDQGQRCLFPGDTSVDRLEPLLAGACPTSCSLELLKLRAVDVTESSFTGLKTRESRPTAIATAAGPDRSNRDVQVVLGRNATFDGMIRLTPPQR